MKIILVILSLSMTANIFLSLKVVDLEGMRQQISRGNCASELKTSDGLWIPDNRFAWISYEYCLYENINRGNYIDNIISSYLVDYSYIYITAPN